MMASAISVSAAPLNGRVGPALAWLEQRVLARLLLLLLGGLGLA